MDLDDYRASEQNKALSFPHFSVPFQAVIWRNWGLVCASRLAAVLRASEEQIEEAAEQLGLSRHPHVSPHWQGRGYITIIRNNWHLLPYSQLLELLQWSEEQLSFALKEDDFLWIKLGSLKPSVDPVFYRALTEVEIQATGKRKEQLQTYCADNENSVVPEKPFAFLERYQNADVDSAPNANEDNSFKVPAREKLRLVYSYNGVYGDPLLDDKLDPYPHLLLKQLSDVGVNGIWLQSVFYQLVPWEAAPELSEGWEDRLHHLRGLISKAAKYGIGVYLYCNEPRAMPNSFFETNPELMGHTEGEASCLCTSHPRVQQYIRDSAARLFQEVPDLAGLFTITMSENLTNCYSRAFEGETNCPRCAQREPEEIVAEVVTLITEGARSSKADADILCWNWGWLMTQWDEVRVERCMKQLPDGIRLMATSEEGLSVELAGISGRVVDYSISQVGPSDWSSKCWEYGRSRGLEAVAKVQLNNSWECSAVPYLPVLQVVERHLANLRRAGVESLMLSWTLGGYPSMNLAFAAEYFQKAEAGETFDANSFLVNRFGKDAGALMSNAMSLFSQAFQQFPFHIQVLYTAPQNRGPSNLLSLQPTGYKATMVGIPYDDLNSWRGDYPHHVLEEQFRKLASGWLEGVRVLEEADVDFSTDVFDRISLIAKAAYIHFQSAYLQIAFLGQREQWLAAEDGKNRAAIARGMVDCLTQEMGLARELSELIQRDSRIGYEASNHYYYSIQDLKEKILNCLDLQQQLQKGVVVS